MDQFRKAFLFFDPNAACTIQWGYYYFSSVKFKGNRAIDCPNNKYNGQNLDAVLTKVTRDFVENTNTEESIQCGRILASEYKIHLMPKSQYVIPVLAALLGVFVKDESLCQLIYRIKVQISPNQAAEGEIMPRIVIYPALGKDNAQKVLDKILEIFSEYELDKIGLDLLPRYNTKINNLVYYSQSGGDVKKGLSTADQQLFLTESRVHFSWGEQRLTKPAEANKPVLPLENENAEDTVFVTLKAILSEAFTDNKKVKALEINNGTPNVPGKHLRLWVDPSIKGSNYLKAMMRVFEEFGITYSTKLKPGAGDFMVLQLPLDSSFILEKNFSKHFIRYFLNKLEELESSPPPAKKQKISA